VTKRSDYRAALESLLPEQWVAYLDIESGLPGPRGNIELAEAFADVADPAFIRRCAQSRDEYLAMCGAVGLGRLLADGELHAAETLRALATDSRWRVREGVAMALQRPGDANMPALWAVAEEWVDGPPLVQRAIAAGICEPRLLSAPDDARRALEMWAATDDKDVRWIVRENLKKARLAKADAAAAERLAAALERGVE
jgi:hypothetical protein